MLFSIWGRQIATGFVYHAQEASFKRPDEIVVFPRFQQRERRGLEAAVWRRPGFGRRCVGRLDAIRWLLAWVCAQGAFGCGRAPEPVFGSRDAVEDLQVEGGDGAPVAQEGETSGANEEGGGAEAEGASTATVDGAQTIVVGMRAIRRGLNPLGSFDAWRQRVAEDLVFEGLLARSPGRRPWVIPALADRCEVDDPAAPRIVACHLTPGAVFHDGAEVKPQDVVYSLSWWLDPRRRALALDRGLGALSRVSVVDGPGGGKSGEEAGRWIRIDFDTPEPLALERLTAMPIVPRVLHRGREESFARAPIGSGPMRVVTMDDDHWILRAEPGWSRGARSGVRYHGLELRRMEDPAAILVALRRGEVDIFPDFPTDYVQSELTRLGASRRYRAWLTSPPRFDVLLFNADAPITSRLAVRQALTYGLRQPSGLAQAPVDLNEPVELKLDRLREDFEAAMDPRWLAAQRPPKEANRDGAGALLDREGWVLSERGRRMKGAESLRIPLTWDGVAGASSGRAARVRETWRELGVRTPFATASWGYISALLAQGEFSVGLLRLATHSHEDLYELFHGSGRRNLARIVDLELDAALEAYRGADDLEERRAAQRRVAARLEALRVVQVLGAPWEVLVTNARVGDVEFMDDLPRLDRLSLASARVEGP